MSVSAIRESSTKSQSFAVQEKKGDSNKGVDKPSTDFASKAAEEATQAARAQAEAQRRQDSSFIRPRPQLVALSSDTQAQPRPEQPTFRISSTGALVSTSPVENVDEQARTAINDVYSAELGRPCEDCDRILAEARASGASTLDQVKSYVRDMVSGSPEKAALNHVNGQFEQHLGRSLTVPEQRGWLEGSGLDPHSPTFQQDVTGQITSSEEYRVKHPANSQSWLGKVPLIDQRWPGGATNQNYWNGSSNCGPTSAAMVARALGYGEGKSDAALVMEMMRTGGTTEAGSSPDQVARMIRSTGTQATVIDDPRGLGDLDAAVDAGKMAVINGDYYATGVPGRDGSGMSGHFCVVTGKDAQGNFIVNDPWKGEQLTFSRQAMQNYFSEHNLKGALVIVEQPGAGGPTPTTPGGNTPPSSQVPAAGLSYDGGTSYNAEVEKLQRALVQAGYLSASDMASGPGYYGNKTASAVARLQADSGIDSDGRTYGPATRAALEQKLS
jgi:hypothetical protein